MKLPGYLYVKLDARPMPHDPAKCEDSCFFILGVKWWGYPLLILDTIASVCKGWFIHLMRKVSTRWEGA